MLGFRTKDIQDIILEKPLAATAATGVITPTKPLPREIRAETYSLDEYAALCADLGFQPVQLLEQRIMRFLAQKNITTYDLKAVDDYMKSICPKDKFWCWKALRPADAKLSLGHDRMYEYHGLVLNYIYNRVVPLAELRKVKVISDELNANPEKPLVGFYVSDYEVPTPDPFIMLKAQGLDPIVFGVWDEPGFGIT